MRVLSMIFDLLQETVPQFGFAEESPQTDRKLTLATS